MPIAEIVWFIIPEILANPTVKVIVYKTKLVKSPIESYSSITNFPPKYKMLKTNTFANAVAIKSIIP